jgi:hypothetical protein
MGHEQDAVLQGETISKFHGALSSSPVFVTRRGGS